MLYKKVFFYSNFFEVMLCYNNICFLRYIEKWKVGDGLIFFVRFLIEIYILIIFLIY